MKTKEDLYAEGVRIGNAINAKFDDLERKNRILIAALKRIQCGDNGRTLMDRLPSAIADEALKKVGEM